MQARRPRVEGPIEGQVNRFRHGDKELELQSGPNRLTLKLPKPLRAPLARELKPGMSVRAWVKPKGKKLKAILVLPLAPRPLEEVNCQAELCRHSQILVCNSKHCCRRGGGDPLLSAIRRAVGGRSDIQVRKCGCLKACGKGPNIEIDGECISKCELREVPALLDRLFPLRVN